MSRDAARDDEVQGFLRGLLVRLPALPTADFDLVEEFISNYEYRLAVEVLMDAIEERGLVLSEPERLAVAEAGRSVRVGPEYAHWMSSSRADADGRPN